MRVFLLAVIIIVFSACTPKEKVQVAKPKPFYNEAKMVEVVTDFRLAEAAVRQMIGYGENSTQLTEYYYNKVLEKNKITAEDFEANLKYYSSYPDQMHLIYSKVVNRLTEMHSEITTRE